VARSAAVSSVSWQRRDYNGRLRFLGIDQVAFGPALVIIVLAAVFGGVVTWRAARR